MVTVEVIIRDEAGEVISQQIKGLELGDGRFEQIEQAVEVWKQTTLPEMEAELLKKNRERRKSKAVSGSRMGGVRCGYGHNMASSVTRHNDTKPEKVGKKKRT